MRHEEIWNGFVELFPEKARNVESYYKNGSKVIVLKMIGKEDTLIFYYNGPDDWSFGTKLYRKCPQLGKGDQNGSNK